MKMARFRAILQLACDQRAAFRTPPPSPASDENPQPRHLLRWHGMGFRHESRMTGSGSPAEVLITENTISAAAIREIQMETRAYHGVKVTTRFCSIWVRSLPNSSKQIVRVRSFLIPTEISFATRPPHVENGDFPGNSRNPGGRKAAPFIDGAAGILAGYGVFFPPRWEHRRLAPNDAPCTRDAAPTSEAETLRVTQRLNEAAASPTRTALFDCHTPAKAVSMSDEWRQQAAAGALRFTPLVLLSDNGTRSVRPHRLSIC